MNGIKDFNVPEYMDIVHPERGFFGYLLRCKCLRDEELFGNFIFLDDGNECCMRFPAIKKQREEIQRVTENVGKVGRQGGGKLRIGTAESLLISVLPPVFVEFGRKCPDALLSTKTGPVEDLFEMVRQNEIDLLYFLDRKTDFPEWIKVSEHRERAIFVASAAHPLAGEKHISVERLQKELAGVQR